jgi:hypothetical protein
MQKFTPRPLPAKQSVNAKIGEFSLVEGFKGYVARQDPTTITPDTLVTPSQNVVMNTAGRVATVKGFVLDGPASSVVDSGILSNYDFPTFNGTVRNMRAGFLTTGGSNGKLQFRYQTGTGLPGNPIVVSWIAIKAALTNVRLSFAEFWDTAELKKLLLWVDGSSNVNEWNGAVTTLASVTAPSTSVVMTVNTTPVAGGTFYAVGDILQLNTGTGARVRVTAVNGSAPFNATTVQLLDVGTGGYPVGTVTTTNLSGTPGAGATISITALQTASTITTQGSLTWAQLGFYQTRNMSITINGATPTAYSYQTGYDTTTLTGVTPDPSTSGYTAGTVIYQTPIVNPLSNMQGILATFSPTCIGCGRNNQLYLGSSTSNSLYISRVNQYVSFSFTSPVRLVGEGDLIQLDSPATGFIPMENRTDELTYDLYISEGADRWAVIRSTLSADLTSEKLEHIRLKVSPLQGAKSSRLMGKMKNHIVYIGNDNVANFFGYLSYQEIPELVDFSYTIVDDMKTYDFTDGSIYYFNNYIYVAIPKQGIVRIYNMTDQTKETTSSLRGMEDVDQQPWFWESPITYPISGFYTVNGVLYGHSYSSSESYQLFTSGSFKGQNIYANATFAYDDKGDRSTNKLSNEMYVEGYIKQNTVISATVGGDLGSFASSQTSLIQGNDNGIVSYGTGAHAIGANPLGSQPLGGANLNVSTLPAWFHVILTYIDAVSYLEQISFSTNGIDLQWEIITYGTNASPTAEGQNDIRR